MHICIDKLTIIGSDIGLSPGRCQAIIWTNAGILSVGPLGTNFSEISIKIYTFSFKKKCLKMSSGKSQPFCLRLNMLMGLKVILMKLLPHLPGRNEFQGCHCTLSNTNHSYPITIPVSYQEDFWSWRLLYNCYTVRPADSIPTILTPLPWTKWAAFCGCKVLYFG